MSKEKFRALGGYCCPDNDNCPRKKAHDQLQAEYEQLKSDYEQICSWGQDAWGRIRMAEKALKGDEDGKK